MTGKAFDQFWHLISGASTLNPEVYNQINSLPQSIQVALTVVLIAGLAQAIAQCVVLFINKVKRLRFVLSLGISAIIFVFSFGFWAISLWLVSHLIFNINLELLTVIRTLGLSYAPQMLSFLIGLPYFGIPISVLLTLWSLLAEITAIQEITQLNIWAAFACNILGWIIHQVSQRTIGRPITAFGRWLLNLAAGTELVTDKQELKEIVMAGNQSSSFQISTDLLPQKTDKQQKQKIKPIIKYIVVGIIAFSIVILLSPLSQNFFTIWYTALNDTFKLTINLIYISLIALFCSIIFTPLESLTWWAGWYEPPTLRYSGSLVEEVPDRQDASIYVLYLDGINQGSYQYLPIVENFLDRLANATPPDVVIIKGIMPYSATNRSLTTDRPLAFLWNILDSIAQRNPNNPIAGIINLRNVAAVAVAADPRYSLIQNQGLAQVLFDSLLHFGYPLGSQKPIALIGYSGGGQMSMGAVPFLKQATGAPIEAISLAGVISGNTGAMVVERLYHLVGEKDSVERLGPIMFPGRWPIMFLSNWNHAKRRGKISFISLGPVAHNDEIGPMGTAMLPDGRTHLQQTLDIISGILTKNWVATGLNPEDFRTVSNYELYKQSLCNHPSYYPLIQSVDSQLYQPISKWVGRLILPTAEEREEVKGVLLELLMTDSENKHRVGQVVNLRWGDDSHLQTYVQLVTTDVNFVDRVRVSKREGNIHPERIDNWQNVDPLESLAGARPEDDMIVALPEPVVVEDTGIGRLSLYISREPIQISGCFYGLVKIIQFVGEDLFRVRHYNSSSQEFDGVEEIIYIPSVIVDRNGISPSQNQGLENSPVNGKGWYIYGAKNAQGKFVVQAIAPRALFSLKPKKIISGKKATLDYINYKYWQNQVAPKGDIANILLNPTEKQQSEISQTPVWEEGEQALFMHVYGGIGGRKPEFSPLGIFFGHFAFGITKVVREPLANELQLNLEYRQIYTHNCDGIVAGTISWMKYMGDRQWGWLGTRPTSEIIIKFKPMTEDYDFNGIKFSPLSYIVQELDVMAARYRTGDGTGATAVSPINSCVQDSSQALYTALNRMVAQLKLNPLIMKWLREHPDDEQTQRFTQLVNLVKALENHLTPLGKARADWRSEATTLGGFPVETPLKTLWQVAGSWRSLLPRFTNDQLAMIFLQFGASLWVLRTNQVGGYDPNIEAIVPTDFVFFVPRVGKRLTRIMARIHG
ncbi:MAG: peptidase [Okeania sp. SIO2C2]|uniref:peptidase n=1 Tax=Okeania sp. SIO2C2 TaxID=2607787 RepID=UPI0013BA580B|nr:peptidase [Okeania sp. SIO2C2]NEP86236.1 peptidase [Okeania sp. SIO2C2]